MENTIRRLISFDLAAKDMVKAAEVQKNEQDSWLNAEKQRVYDDFLGKATQRMETVKQNAKTYNDYALAQSEEKYRHALAQLEQSYAKNKQLWMDELVKRTLG